MLEKKYPESGAVLDVGCGYGTKTVKFPSISTVHTVVGVDLPATISRCKRLYDGVIWVSVDLDDKPILPHTEKPFDLIICADVLEHLEDPDKTLDFIKKYSHEKTIILFSTVDRNLYDTNPDGPPKHPCHAREWTDREFVKYLDMSGFIILTAMHVPDYPPGHKEIVCICKYVGD
jgi:predicted TPR repeat methyltransferase